MLNREGQIGSGCCFISSYVRVPFLEFSQTMAQIYMVDYGPNLYGRVGFGQIWSMIKSTRDALLCGIMAQWFSTLKAVYMVTISQTLKLLEFAEFVYDIRNKGICQQINKKNTCIMVLH